MKKAYWKGAYQRLGESVEGERQRWCADLAQAALERDHLAHVADRLTGERNTARVELQAQAQYSETRRAAADTWFQANKASRIELEAMTKERDEVRSKLIVAVNDNEISVKQRDGWKATADQLRSDLIAMAKARDVADRQVSTQNGEIARLEGCIRTHLDNELANSNYITKCEKEIAVMVDQFAIDAAERDRLTASRDLAQATIRQMQNTDFAQLDAMTAARDEGLDHCNAAREDYEIVWKELQEVEAARDALAQRQEQDAATIERLRGVLISVRSVLRDHYDIYHDIPVREITDALADLDALAEPKPAEAAKLADGLVAAWVPNEGIEQVKPPAYRECESCENVVGRGMAHKDGCPFGTPPKPAEPADLCASCAHMQYTNGRCELFGVCESHEAYELRKKREETK